MIATQHGSQGINGLFVEESNRWTNLILVGLLLGALHAPTGTGKVSL